MNTAAFYKVQTREIPATPASSEEVMTCPVEGCEAEFHDADDAREHYARNHLDIPKDDNGLLFFADEETFKLYTSQRPDGAEFWNSPQWEGVGWYHLGYEERPCPRGCCYDYYAKLEKASSWLWSQVWETERKIERLQEKLKDYRQQLEEIESRDRMLAYRQAVRKLEALREKHNGEDSPEEDKHLEEMDALWAELSPEEIEEINKLGEAPSGV